MDLGESSNFLSIAPHFFFKKISSLRVFFLGPRGPQEVQNFGQRDEQSYVHTPRYLSGQNLSGLVQARAHAVTILGPAAYK